MTVDWRQAAGKEEAQRLRVLVVEDSLTIRKYLVHLLNSKGFDVVGEADNGVRALELCRSLHPDVVTMDMILQGMSGLAATEQIMAYCPTPILIVSASTNRGEVMQTYHALAAGAVDVFDKLAATDRSEEWERRFLAAVRMAARIRVITHPRARLQTAAEARQSGTRLHSLNAGTAPSAPKLAVPSTVQSGVGVSLIALGASTGGPAALVQILKGLPADFPVPILIVLHLSELFAFAFADWLNTLSPIPARYARDAEPLPRAGTPQILLAPVGQHMVVEGALLRLTDTPERHSCKPSVDELFDSLARTSHLSGMQALLCLLTGMGKDGATGLLNARKAGLETIAQDEDSSVVFGMPGEAVRLGAAQRVLPLKDIAPAMLAAASTRTPMQRGMHA